MNPKRIAILILCFLSLSFMSACRTTELSERDVRSTLARESQLVSDRIMTEDGRVPVGNKNLQWVLLAAAALGGVMMVFSSERAPEKKAVPNRRKKTTARRRK